MENYSVLMSVYNKVKPEELNLSIRSMLRQTFAPEQFVIVWDGPVNKSLKEIVRHYEIEYPRLFTIVSLEKNMGLAYALNAGIDVCRNDLIARMDSDDYSVPNRCELQVLEFEKDEELVLLGGQTQHFIRSPYEPIGEYSRQPLDIDEIKKCIKRNSAFSHPTVMFKKSIIKRCGAYDKELRRSQDHDLFSRIIYLGYKCKNLNKVLVLFKTDRQGILRNINEDSCKARIVIQKRLLARKQCTIVDFLYVYFGVSFLKILPEKLFIVIYKMIKGGKI